MVLGFDDHAAGAVPGFGRVREGAEDAVGLAVEPERLGDLGHPRFGPALEHGVLMARPSR